ncbi:MAG: pseudouridine-5'-phosphate glycosidase [Cytophagaceae bacterium]|nr:pseudouridine-5'-phosphate glycosidase [Gemmatimonadaceae bacterium]
MTGTAPAESPIRLTPDVRAALAARRPVVALETSVLAQGLPIPHNREAARRMLGAVARHAGVGAFTAVVDGVPALGLDDAELERFLARDGITKVSARDLAPTIAARRSGATTVAGTLALIATTEVTVFATGGIGGVHREGPFDESADLFELATTPAVVVCAGAKSILDLSATVERLETLGVPVVGYRTREFPAFFSATSGLPLSVSVDAVGEVREIVKAHRALGRRQAVLVVQQPPDEHALPAALIDDAVARALLEARDRGVRGPAVTPFLLAAVERATGGRSLTTNLALLEANADLAARIAAALLT